MRDRGRGRGNGGGRGQVLEADFLSRCGARYGRSQGARAIIGCGCHLKVAAEGRAAGESQGSREELAWKAHIIVLEVQRCLRNSFESAEMTEIVGCAVSCVSPLFDRLCLD